MKRFISLAMFSMVIAKVVSADKERCQSQCSWYMTSPFDVFHSFGASIQYGVIETDSTPCDCSSDYSPPGW